MSTTRRVTVGGEEYRIEPFSGRKALRVLHTVKHITKGVPEILDEWARFRTEYEAKNSIVIDRASARRQFPPLPMYDEEPITDDKGVSVRDEDGDPLVRRVVKVNAAGEPVMGPDPLGHMTDADWEASGHVIRLPRSPTQEEQIAAVFPIAMDLAEEQVVRLLALVAMTNAEVKKARHDLPTVLAERGDDLLDADLGDLIELAVVAGECVSDQYQAKARELGGRLGNAGRLIGLNLPTSPTTEATSNGNSSTPNVNSSTDSLSPTDGTSEQPSTEPVGIGSVDSSTD